MNSKEQGKAIAAAERAVRDNPTDYGRLDKLGWAYFYARRYNDAIAIFQRAIGLCPDDARGDQAIGRAYLDNGQTEKALEHCNARSPCIQPTSSRTPAWGHSIRGGWVTMRPRSTRFSAAVALDPEHPFARAQLGWVYACRGRMDEAEATLVETVRRQPDNESALEVLSMAYLSMPAMRNLSPPAATISR